jgi:hypothetical protein
VFSHQAWCAALAIKEKDEKKLPHHPPCERKIERQREKAVSLSLSLALSLSLFLIFPLLPSLLDLYSRRKTMQKSIIPSLLDLYSSRKTKQEKIISSVRIEPLILR